MLTHHCWDPGHSIHLKVILQKIIFLKNKHLTHWGRVTHICVSKLTIIGSDNGLLPGRRQAIIWTNAGILLIGPLGTNFSGILIRIQRFSFMKMHLKMASAKWRPFCLGLNVLRPQSHVPGSMAGTPMATRQAVYLLIWTSRFNH